MANKILLGRKHQKSITENVVKTRYNSGKTRLDVSDKSKIS